MAVARAAWLRLTTRATPRFTALYQLGAPGRGSAWIAALLHDPIVCAAASLRPVTRPAAASRAGVLAAGLDLSYRDFVRLRKPEPWRAVYVVQDPRALWLERYEAIRTGRAHDPAAQRSRDAVRERTGADALHVLLGHLEREGWFRRARGWIDLGALDPGVRVVRHEEIARAPERELEALLGWFGIELSSRALRQLLRRHPVTPPTPWRERLEPAALASFRTRTADLVAALGYRW
ncbi:MAG: hypothetical protein D6776_09470 [Planctomycetota bacterium]|nr:MAG: hypothetical protein D6776_09470 [Planctomycetota bacterium]